MSRKEETQMFNAIYVAEGMAIDGETAAAGTPEDRKRTDRPATSRIALAATVSTTPTAAPVSMALEPAAAAVSGTAIRAKLEGPMENLSKLFNLMMDDLDALPILQSEMLSELNMQLGHVQQIVAGMEPVEGAAEAAAEAAQANALYDALRLLRTPMANMEGLLSLILDDREALPQPVAQMLLVAYEQLEKFVAAIDRASEALNLAEGKIDVRYQDSALEAVIDHAIRNARDEGFDRELVYSNQVPPDALAEVDATSSQCLEALIRHAMLDTLNAGGEAPIGLFVYLNEENGQAQVTVELHEQTVRAPGAGFAARTLDQQIVAEMTQALRGEYQRTAGPDGEIVVTATIPADAIRHAVGAEAQAAGANQAAAPAAPANTYQGAMVLGTDRQLARVIEEAVANRLLIQRASDFDHMLAEIEKAYLPTLFLDADLLKDLNADQRDRLTTAAEQVTHLYVLQHAEAEVDAAGALFPVVWDDDLLAITGMLEHPFQAGTTQENLVLVTGDAATEIRPWRKLLSSTGHGLLWWPAARPIEAERFPQTIGGIVVLAESTRVLTAANWNALTALQVRDRRVLVLTGNGTCQLPSARGWDIYRPNPNVCDDTLRRYILFNSPHRQQPRVAVIEDDILMRKLLASTVEDQAQIVEMGSVREALEKLRTMSFDVILLDLFLPDGSGLKILDAIRNDPCLKKARNTPILSLTGSSDLTVNKEALDRGACEVLVKPVPMQVLRQKIALLTRQNRSTRISGPVSIPAEKPAAVAAAAKPAPASRPGASKIINLRALKAHDAKTGNGAAAQA
ncbi:MAG: response regulator [Planctomycetota bacterium]